ncbi:MAG: glycosyltransferase family 4 protein [Kofleriaceae bacterium]
MKTTDRLRVLMTADTIGGVWTYACELARALGPLGVDVTLATMGAPPNPAQAATVAAIRNVELVASTFALEWMPDPWHDVDAAGDWLLEVAHRVHPDIVHVNGYAHAALAFGVPVVSVAHSCVASWFRAVRGREAPPEWDEYRRRTRAGLLAANEVIAPTRAILTQILEAHGIEPIGRVIPNGCASAAWRPGTKEPFILAAGRLWDEAKGLPELDACASRVAWPIHVAGPTLGPAGIGGVEARGVRLLGELRRDALADWMARASIYALPARYEPFGLSIVEAALSGAALVLGRIATLEETWGDAALYVPPGDPDALALALDGLGRDERHRRSLAAAARSRALALTPERMAGAYRAVYGQLLGARQEVCA